ncbi:hypothetical protein [Nocardioides sp.]|uniref:FitA-like ribbon-helix-helix domain-containing protein n=1 Tax=Nocardioides sp. TaxID=35761 RepID=UPI0026300A9A|nr:hypothetical protein [Nocardioides sp.]
MVAVHIRNVPEETVARLKARAASNGRSYEAELRIVLDEAALAPAARQRRQIAWPPPPPVSVTIEDRHELYYPDDENHLLR